MAAIALNARNGLSVGPLTIAIIDAYGNVTVPITATLSVLGASTLAAVGAASLSVSGTTTLSGASTATTQAVNNNSTLLSTTAFVLGQAGTATPLMDSTATVGSSFLYARQDHIHASDTSRLTVINPSATGSLIVTGNTITASSPVLDTSQTWNNNPITFTGIRLQVTNTSSSASSKLIDLSVGGVSQFAVSVSGTATLTGGVNLGGNLVATGNITSVNTTSSGVLTGQILQVNGAATFGSSASFNTASFSSTTTLPTQVPQTGSTLTVGSTLGATVGFVTSQAATVAPLMDGVATIGVNLMYARQDHVHASDTSRLTVINPSATGSLIVTGASVTTSTPVLSATQTWNNSVSSFNGILLNITNTQSAISSNLINLEVGGVSQFAVSVGGNVTNSGTVNVGTSLAVGTNITTGANSTISPASGTLTIGAIATNTYIDSAVGGSVVIRPNGSVVAGTFSTTGLVLAGSLGATSGSFSGQITSTVSTGTAPFAVTSTTNVANLNASYLGGATFASPGPIGSSVASSAAHTIISATGQFTSTIVTGTAPFIVASTTNVPNLNASSLNGATFAAPGAIGSGTASTGSFTTLLANTHSGLTLTPLTVGFSIAGGTTSKTLTVSNSLTLAGADGTVMTLPSTSATIARTDANQTFSGTQTFSTIAATTLAISGNATVAGSLTVTGGLTISGATTTVSSQTLLGVLASVTGSMVGTTTLTITGGTTSGIQVGQFVTGAGIAPGTTVATITGLPTSITVSSAQTVASTTIYFAAADSTVVNGGLILKGTTDKYIEWSSTIPAWNSSENWNLLTGKSYYINGSSVLSATALGSGVVSSQLTSLGTIGTGVWQGSTVGVLYGGTGVTTSTGTGSNVLNTSPSFITPVLGTPTSGTLTNCTGLPYTGLTGTPTIWNQNTTGTAAGLSATLVVGSGGTGVTTSTGTGSNVLSTSPTLVTPLLGTPTSGVLTNCTGLPYTGLTGVVPTWNQSTTGNAATATNVAYTGLTGVVPTWNQSTTGNAATVTTNANLTGPITSVGNTTSIGSQTGTGSTFVMSTSPTLITPALGTPASGVLTNCSGTAAALSIGGNAATATNVAYTGLTGVVPTWNQSTTGNAATATTATNQSGGTVGATTISATGLITSTVGASGPTVGNTSLLMSGTTTGSNYLQWTTSGGSYYVGVDGSSGGSLGTSAYDLVMDTPTGRGASLAVAQVTILRAISTGVSVTGTLNSTGAVTGSNLSGTNTGDSAANGSTHYIGTTAIALNRASAAQALTGITSIDGNAATATLATGATNLAGGTASTAAAAINGYGLWGSAPLGYGMLMSRATDTTYGGRITGETTSDYNIYFSMTQGTNRGFVFRNAYPTPLFAINGDGVRSVVPISSTGTITGSNLSGTNTGDNPGVTSVSGTGTVSGLTLSGTVTTTGNLTLGGTLAVTPANFASQTSSTFLAAPNGTAGVPTFRGIVASDVPTLNQNTTGNAATATQASYATGLMSTSTTVYTNTNAAPTAGQVLTATSGTAANWQTLSPASFFFASGDVKSSASSAAQTGWLACDGTSYTTAAYPALYASIGYTWGGGGGNFNVPDFRGRTLIGNGTGGGLTARTVGQQTIGEETHLLSTNEMPVHTHAASDSGHAHTIPYNLQGVGAAGGGTPIVGATSPLGTSTSYANISVANAGNGAAHNNMQPSAVIHWLIKT